MIILLLSGFCDQRAEGASAASRNKDLRESLSMSLPYGNFEERGGAVTDLDAAGGALPVLLHLHGVRAGSQVDLRRSIAGPHAAVEINGRPRRCAGEHERAARAAQRDERQLQRGAAHLDFALLRLVAGH